MLKPIFLTGGNLDTKIRLTLKLQEILIDINIPIWKETLITSKIRTK